MHLTDGEGIVEGMRQGRKGQGVGRGKRVTMRALVKEGRAVHE